MQYGGPLQPQLVPRSSTNFGGTNLRMGGLHENDVDIYAPEDIHTSSSSDMREGGEGSGSGGVGGRERGEVMGVEGVEGEEEREEENMVCSICLEGIKAGGKVRKIGCCHVFCADCLKKWLSLSTKCPSMFSFHNPFLQFLFRFYKCYV